MSGPGGWYLDSVLMHSWLDGEPRSNRGVGIDLEGHATMASLEGGYPIWLTDKISLEPQAQIIWQHVGFDPTQDRFSSVSSMPTTPGPDGSGRGCRACSRTARPRGGPI